jgi:hypothetical protein
MRRIPTYMSSALFEIAHTAGPRRMRPTTNSITDGITRRLEKKATHPSSLLLLSRGISLGI